MKHLLTWSPVIVPEETIHYSVEYQGEYESLYLSHLWIPSHWCSPTKSTECDITDDITATVWYNLRVRATLGSQTSAWSTLEHPFNRNSTILTPPKIEVTKDGFHMVILLEDLGPQFEFYVAYWKSEPGTKEHVKVVKSGGIPVHLETMEPAARYCVKAQTFVKTIERHSAFSQAECIEVQGKDRRGPPPGTGPVWICWLHAAPCGCAAFHLENGPGAPVLLLPLSGPPRHLENHQFTPEVNQLQKGRGRTLCHVCAVF
ncbi:interleukin-20 receptor subunit beta isoform X1 [Loxodonta africana]|uniref:interleukin-20 receptor subunit beta isoform X1 n=1 Tax=Loxodonta africana TaxID=9785 RepID=UPI0030CBDB5E